MGESGFKPGLCGPKVNVLSVHYTLTENGYKKNGNNNGMCMNSSCKELLMFETFHVHYTNSGFRISQENPHT